MYRKSDYNKGDAAMKLIKTIESWFHDKELEHKIAVIHRYNRMLRKEIARGYDTLRIKKQQEMQS